MEREERFTRTHAERVALIEQMMTNGKWSLVLSVPSSENTYYLFASKANPSERVGINSGESDLFEDVSYCYFDNSMYK